MKEIELCMKYTCKMCPLNMRCDIGENKPNKKDDRKERRKRQEIRKAKGMYNV